MNTRAINSAAGVICAAQQRDRTAAGIALALDAAGHLNSPEHAAELEQLRKERETALAQRNAVLGTNEQLQTRVEEAGLARITAENEARTLARANKKLRDRVAALEGERAESHSVDEDPIAYALTPKADAVRNVTPQVRKLRALLAGQREQTGGAPC
ncbi:hypothetical protein [Streptomyces sp. NPDC057302]|uniref:hypothetical protein n=1 Tax=Streptomyces sp. NPDC057302 TaxID=3346094 RepID=UPI00363976AC